MSPSTLEPARFPVPSRERWTALRAGIQNVWEYDDRRFVFHKGRMLLRGQNEAGKTKAMELLFPFLLDADLAPQRLDPFGTTARPMRWNLVNEHNPEVQLRLGYLWLELGRREEGAERYCTIGAGLKARRGAPDVEAWYFVTDQRPDRDLTLVQDGRPLTRTELHAAVEGRGQIFERGSEYRRAVNAKFFGMPEQGYAALVDTLLHLRRPQLSKGLDLDQLSGFLAASLPPLDGGVVGPIAEGFERIDHHRADLEALQATLAQLRAFSDVYGAYARAVARGRAQELTRSEAAHGRARAEARERLAEREALLARRSELEAGLRALQGRERALEERVRALEASEAYRAVGLVDAAEEASRRAEAVARQARERSADDERAREQSAFRAGEAERETVERAAELGRCRSLALSGAAGAVLGEAHAEVDRLAGEADAAAVTGALQALRAERERLLSSLRGLAQELGRATEAERRAGERARERAADLERAQEALALAERLASEAEEAWLAAVEQWAATLEALPRTGLAAPSSGDAPADPAGWRRALETVAEPLRRSLAERRADASARLATVRADAAALRAEREALVRAPHPTPPAPAWRRSRPAGRPGAPLYVLCDFGPAAAGSEALLEAALEGSGLLDAWVEPDGTLLDPRTEDVLLRGAPAPGPSLAEVLVPVAACGITLERARAALSRIGFAAAGAAAAGDCWVAADGRWRLGPLEGALAKDAPAYVGATARERERERRIAALAARMGALEANAGELETQAARAASALDRLAAELAQAPSGTALAAARERVDLRAEARLEARDLHAEAERLAEAAELARTRAASALDRAAAEAGVASFARDPEALGERSRAYFSAVEALAAAAGRLARSRVAEAREAHGLAEARERAARSADLAAQGSEEAQAAASRFEALREASGQEREGVLAALGAARADQGTVRREREVAGSELRGVEAAGAVAGERASQAEAAIAVRDAERRSAAGLFQALAPPGVLVAAGFALEDAEPSYTALLELARSVDAGLPPETGPEERERAEDRLIRRQAELAVQLPADLRVLPSRAGDVLSYAFTWNGRTRPAAEVVAEVEAEVVAREALLGAQESELLERFLSGEAHEHLAARLREARATVDRMNAALEGRTTAAGAQVRLTWELDEASADAGAREAVPLFLRAGHLLSEANRAALREFLQRRLGEARASHVERPLQDRLLEVLDYRAWHHFGVEHRAPGLAWAKLTRKAHAAGSGGKKAVMLHLPLFAAAASFYDSAGPAAPRIIALDEAFAGIDRPTRGRLMGLLAEFDLDFLMTSFEEWGFYEELDGLSTYQLSREPGQRGVFAEWFLWDGHERLLMEES